MPSPTARLLELLDLLQSAPLVTGRRLSDALGVDGRTVRRDVATLQRLGIPVEGERGVGGGYRLRPGYRLPPLMLNDAEALAVVVALAAARGLGIDADGVEGALAKIHRVLPDALRRRVAALEAAVTFTTVAAGGDTAPSEVALLLADAIRRGRRVATTYRSYSGDESVRDISPFGLVVHSGRWYLAAHDHGRDALRTFRVDRIRDARLADDAAAAPPPDFDAVDHVARSLARVPWPWEVEVLLELPLEEARRRVPRTLAELDDANGETLLRMRVSSLDWTASLLAGLGCAFSIRRPDELRASVRALAQRLADSSEGLAKYQR